MRHAPSGLSPLHSTDLCAVERKAFTEFPDSYSVLVEAVQFPWPPLRAVDRSPIALPFLGLEEMRWPP